MNFRRPPSASPVVTLCPFMQVPLALAQPLPMTLLLQVPSALLRVSRGNITPQSVRDTSPIYARAARTAGALAQNFAE